MKRELAVAVGAAWLASTPAHAIDAKYRQQLERSGCTQVSEMQGCDIHKTREENARAGFAAPPPAAKPAAPSTPYAGQWVAKDAAGATVATIRVDARERVWVDGQRVTAKRSDGGLLFRDGKRQYFIQGDRRLKDEDYWTGTTGKTRGTIVAE